MKAKTQQKNVNQGWLEALEDAKRKHAEGRRYVAKMRSIIRTIEGKIAAGERFPDARRQKIVESS